MILNDFTIILDWIFFARLRRGDFRYTTIIWKAIYDYFFFAFGEAILGTQRYFPKQFTVKCFWTDFHWLTDFLIFPPSASA